MAYSGDERRIERQADLVEMGKILVKLTTQLEILTKNYDDMKRCFDVFVSKRQSDCENLREFCRENKEKCWTSIDDKFEKVIKEAKEYAKTLVTWAIGVPASIIMIINMISLIHNIAGK